MSAVVIGKRRFTCLSPHLVRMEFAPDGIFEDRRSIVAHAKRTPIPFVRVEETKGVTILDTGFMRVVTRENGRAFFPANLTIQWQRDGMLQHWCAGDKDHENLGGTIHSLDLFGMDTELGGVSPAGEDSPDNCGRRWHIPWDTNCAVPFDRLYESTAADRLMDARRDRWSSHHGAIRNEPDSVQMRQRNLIKDQHRYCPGILSRAGYFLLNDSLSTVMDADDYPVERARPGTQDWYFFCYNGDYAQALGDFILLTGRAPLPTKNTFGLFFSRYPAYDHLEAREIIGRFAEEKIPLSTLVIDMEWHLNSWCHWDWNPEFYPDPKGFFDWAHDEGIEITLNVHPDRIDDTDSHFAPYVKEVGRFDFAEIDRDVTTSGAPGGRRVQRLNLCRKEEALPFFDIFQSSFKEVGLDYWWLDGEAGFINGTQPHLIANKLFYEDCETTTKRGMLLSRYGGLGSHRYGVYFTGDTYSEWETLAMQCEFNIRAGHVGVAYLSHDMGGFIYPNAPLMEPKLYIRWLQFGAFNPVFRLHSAPGCGNRQPWAYGEENLRIARRWLQVRNSLLPYVYTAARRHYDTGIPVVRGLFLDRPGDEGAYRFDQFLFGDSILVAPILTPRNHREVYLPAGIWYEFETSSRVDGGRVITVPATLDRIPVYVKAGSIIPRQPVVDRPAAAHVARLILDVHPGADGRGELYEDDGKSRDYEGDGFCRTQFELKDSGNTITVSSSVAQGKPLGNKREVSICLYDPRAVERVSLNGSEIPKSACVSDEARRATIIALGSVAPAETMKVQIELE